MAETLSTLPEDVIFEILLGVQSVKSIGRFRCVSKACRSRLSTPQFAKSHTQIHIDGPQDIFFLHGSPMVATKSASNRSITNRKVKFPDSVPEFDYCFVQGSCHGLVLVLKDLELSNDGFLFLVNPVSRKAVEIPQIPGSNIAYGLGYDSCTTFTDDYKIVLIVRDVLHISSVKTRTWRTLQNSSPYHSQGV